MVSIRKMDYQAKREEIKMPTSYRLPDDVQADLKKLAKIHERSANAEIIVALKKYIREQKRCEYDGCIHLAEIECNIGKCAPVKWYCGMHYIEVHIPDEPQDEE